MHPTRFLSLNQTLFTGSILKKRYSALSFLPQFGKFLRSCTKQNQIAVVECGNKITVKKAFYLESAKIVSLFGSAPMVCQSGPSFIQIQKALSQQFDLKKNAKQQNKSESIDINLIRSSIVAVIRCPRQQSRRLLPSKKEKT